MGCWMDRGMCLIVLSTIARTLEAAIFQPDRAVSKSKMVQQAKSAYPDANEPQAPSVVCLSMRSMKLKSLSKMSVSVRG